MQLTIHPMAAALSGGPGDQGQVDSECVRVLRRSFPDAGPPLSRLVKLWASRLGPEVRSALSPPAAARLADLAREAVAALDDPLELREALLELGRAGSVLGIGPSEARRALGGLLAAMREASGSSWCEATHDEWALALELAARAIERGAATPCAPRPGAAPPATRGPLASRPRRC